MALTVSRVVQDAATLVAANDCYFHATAVTCLVDEQYRFLHWEGKKPNIAAQLDTSQVRLFGSSDQGATWGTVVNVSVPIRTQWNELFSPGGTRLLAGILDHVDGAYDPQFSYLPRSEDGGLTWVSSVSAAFFATALGVTETRTMRFTRLPTTTTVLAVGRYTVNGNPFNVLRSLDNGVTWAPLADVGVDILNHVVGLSATDVVAVDGTGLNAFFSHDGGATWAAASKPFFSDVIGSPMAMGGGVVLTFGRTTGAALGAIFRSVDSGETYTLFTLIGGEVNGPFTLRAVSPSDLIAGANGPSPSATQKWWLSADGGASWTPGTLTNDVVTSSDSSSMTITTQGVMLAALSRPTRATVSSQNFGELWRGLVDGFVPTGIGTCEAVALPPEPPVVVAATLGIRLDCVPILSPQPCPPLCPVDPVGPVAQLIFPVPPSGPGGGWRSALFLLGLADGTEALTVTPALLTRPSACGATFANNNCAVAGA